MWIKTASILICDLKYFICIYTIICNYYVICNIRNIYFYSNTLYLLNNN